MVKKLNVSQEMIDEVLRPDYFYDYGDNPAYKKLVEMAKENIREGKNDLTIGHILLTEAEDYFMPETSKMFYKET